MKRLIFFTRDLRLGGVERALVRLVNALAPRHDVTLVLEVRDGLLLKELDGRVRLEVLASAGSRLTRLVRLALWALKNARRYDFSCAYGGLSRRNSLLALLASKNACLYIHNDLSRIFPEEKRHAAFVRALRAGRFRRILFVSRESRDAFAAREPDLAGRTEVLGNLIDAARIRALALAPCPFVRGEGETVLLFLGRLDERQKRLSRLLHAFALSAAEREDLRLLLVGEGPDRALCEETIRRLGLETRVRLVPAQQNPYPWLAAADGLVLSSDYEGFPLACYEALVLGRQVVSTVAVSDETVDLRAHALICAPSAAALARAMCRCRPGEAPALDAESIDRARLRRLEELF